MKDFEQLFIAVFGLTALHLGLGVESRLRRWAPLIGLCGQPFWVVHAWKSGGWGIAILVAAYTVVYANAALVQWTGRGLRDRSRWLFSMGGELPLALLIALAGLFVFLAYGAR